MPNAFLVQLFQHKAWCGRRLVQALRAAPADVDRAQMALMLFTFDHTSIVDQIFKARLVGEEPGFSGVVASRRPDLDTLAQTLAETDAWYVDYAGRVTAAELDETLEFTFVSDGQAGRMTRSEILAHVLTHSASHRGAVGKMLENLGLSAAPDMVTTFVREVREGVADGPTRSGNVSKEGIS